MTEDRQYRIPNLYAVARDDTGLLVMWDTDGVGQVSLFDLYRFDEINDYYWWVGPNGYVQSRKGSQRDGSLQHFRLHRLVLALGSSDPLRADHINGDRLDNRRVNLRAVTNQQNVAHQAVINNRGTSRYRGVSWSAHQRKWVVHVKLNLRSTYVGAFATEDEAAAALRAFRADNGLPTGY